ncbi:MAG TPA: AMP-binding protein [Myxococcota bacterium]|nr:AMP-binding protein [Myxococcota bacterium]
MNSPLHNVGAWTLRRAQIGPDHLAVVDAERSLDYRALHERTGRSAALLAAHGVGAGDRVALLLGNRTAYLELVLAAARIGAIAVPLNARLTAPEVRGLLGDCTPALLVHEQSHDALARDAAAGLARAPHRLACPDPYEAELAQRAPHEEILSVSPEHAMMLMYTSGTTGEPKGSLLPHRKTLYNSLNAALFFGLARSDRVLVALPLFHSFGLSILSLPALYAGAAVFLEPRFDAARTWQRVHAERITYLGAVPTQLAALLGEVARGGPSPPPSLRFLFGAGAAVPVEQIRAFESRGIILKQGFGQTETSILCCLDASDAIRKAGSVGRPVFHAELRVVTQATIEGPVRDWCDAAVGEPGEIVVRGPITMLGYWNKPDATAATLRGEWLRTGDLATCDAEGFLTLVGRAKDMYISGGENVYPAEIEAAYAQHPAVREIAVVGVPDPRWGEVGRAFVVPRDGRSLDVDALRAWGAERLARFKLPRDFVAVPTLPRTETGKVQKHRLAGGSPTADASAAVRGEDERAQHP